MEDRRELDEAALAREAAEGYEVNFRIEHSLGGVEASVDKDQGTVFSVRLDEDSQMSVSIPSATKNRAEVTSYLEDCYGEFGHVRSNFMEMGGLVIVDSPAGIMLIDHPEGTAEVPKLEVIVFSYALEELKDRMDPLKDFVRQVTDAPLITTNKAFDEVLKEGKLLEAKKGEGPNNITNLSQNPLSGNS